MRLAQMRLLSCVAITVAIGSVQLPSQCPVDFRVFSKCESNSTDDEDRVFLRSEKQAMPLTTVIDDYVHEIENGNLFRIANSILAAEKYSVVQPTNQQEQDITWISVCSKLLLQNKSCELVTQRKLKFISTIPFAISKWLRLSRL